MRTSWLGWLLCQKILLLGCLRFRGAYTLPYGRIPPMHLIHRKTCRVCQSSALTKVIDLGEQYLQGSFVKPGRQQPPLRKVPTSLVRCDPMRDEKACGLLQMEFTVPPEVLYSVYWYRSGTTATMRGHLAGIAEEATALL